MDKLVDDFKISLFCSSKDVLTEYLEIGIDSFINDGLLKDLPIVSTIVAILKVGKNVYDRNLLKQTLTFIEDFNHNNLSQEEIDDYCEKIESDDKKCEEELGRVLLLLNSFIDTPKSRMLSRLFKAYLKKVITWDEFCEYGEIIKRMFMQDFPLLKNIYFNVVKDTSNRNDLYRVERLNSLGIIGMTFQSLR